MWGSQWLGGGGCNVFLTFYAIYNISRIKKKIVRKTIISHLMFSSCFFNAGNIEKGPFTYWLNGEVVSPNSRYTEFEHKIGKY